ncbi:hypothetical protein N9414_11739 [Nodularia spumigena CCY9414]|nr:hypothetical protein N9414_11739 [Nodularia spumigena CCY9414]
MCQIAKFLFVTSNLQSLGRLPNSFWGMGQTILDFRF